MSKQGKKHESLGRLHGKHTLFHTFGSWHSLDLVSYQGRSDAWKYKIPVSISIIENEYYKKLLTAAYESTSVVGQIIAAYTNVALTSTYMTNQDILFSAKHFDHLLLTDPNVREQYKEAWISSDDELRKQILLNVKEVFDRLYPVDVVEYKLEPGVFAFKVDVAEGESWYSTLFHEFEEFQ